MANQLEAKYEQHIHSLLEQIKANEPQKVTPGFLQWYDV